MAREGREDGFLYFEDFEPGAVFDLGKRTLSKEEIVAFAREFDPQPFHVDEEAANESTFGGLIASGWHTASIFMRLYADSLLSRAGRRDHGPSWSSRPRPGH
jgi:acyl dehydratase